MYTEKRWVLYCWKFARHVFLLFTYKISFFNINLTKGSYKKGLIIEYVQLLYVLRIRKFTPPLVWKYTHTRPIPSPSSSYITSRLLTNILRTDRQAKLSIVKIFAPWILSATNIIDSSWLDNENTSFSLIVFTQPMKIS